MPDICDLILDDHETQRRRFAELDELRSAGAEPDALARTWGPLADLLELHAAAEEQVFYPSLLDVGVQAKEETTDAISDHNKIRDAVAEAGRQEPGSDGWWKAVAEAREQNSDHMGEEERGAIADLRSHAEPEQREALGARFQEFEQRHAGGRDLDASDKSPDDYVAEHG